MGHINRSSRSLTLSIITQSVTHFRNSSRYFGDFYSRMISGKSYGKARVALIRNILVSAYYMLKRDEGLKWSDKSNMQRKVGLLDTNAECGEMHLIKSA